MDDLRGRTLRGGLAKLAGQAVNFVLRFGFLVIMARLLEPVDFGLVAMVTVVTGVYELFTTAGLSMATIQRSEIDDAQLSTLFWINVLVGFLLALLCLATAPALVAFYGEPRLMPIAAAMGAGFLLSTAGVQHYALLQRDLRYVTIALLEVISNFASISLGIVLAYAGYRHWSLVAAAISAPAFLTALSWAATGWIPGRPHFRSGVTPMVKFGATVTLNSLAVYVAYNLDKVLLGRFWGAEALGVYSRAYQLINIPVANLNNAVSGVTFSALSRLQNDTERFRRYFLKSYCMVVSLTMPTAAFLALMSKDVVLVVLGPKWYAAVDLVRLLAPTILIFGIINPIGSLLYAAGLQTRSLIIACVIIPVAGAGYTAGLAYGPWGVALGYSAAMTLWLVPHVYWCLHGTVVTPRDLMRASYEPAAASIVAAVAVYLVGRAASGLEPPLLRLLLEAAVMATAYWGMLLFVLGQKAFYAELVKGLKGPNAPDRAPQGENHAVLEPDT